MVGARVRGRNEGLQNGSGAEDEEVLDGIQASIAGVVVVLMSKFIEDNFEADDWRAFAERKADTALGSREMVNVCRSC